MNDSSRKIRNTVLLSSALFVPLIINKLVFFTAQKKFPIAGSSHTYDWRLGKVSYTVNGSGKPVVLIHGYETGSSSAVWTKNVGSLAESYKVYTLDLLGYGTSERVNTTYTAYTYASLINDFITDVVGKPSAVIAEGGGAMFAAAAYEKNPKNFKRLIFICPKGLDGRFATNEDKKRRKFFELPVIGESIYLMNTSLAALKAMLSQMIYSKDKTRLLTERFYSSSHYGGGANRFPYASLRTNFMNTDIKPYISSVKIPILIVWGEKAEDIKNFEKIKGLTKRAEYALFEDTARLPNYENAEEFNNLAKEFLK